MTLALLAMSHSPLLEHAELDADVSGELENAFTEARRFVHAFDPDVVVNFAPDHYNGFFYRLMPPFCIGTAASGVGDYGTLSGPLNVATDIANACATAVLDADVDVSISAGMDVDHGTVQPLQSLFGDATAVPLIPIFINSVATPLGPIRRVRALGTAIGEFLATLGKRVLVVGSGGLSHDPPVPTLATAPPAALERIVHGAPMSAEQRAARQTAVIAAAHDFAHGSVHGKSTLQPLNPDWDHAFLELLDTNRLADIDAWDNGWIAGQAGNSAHEVRTWVAAFAALAASGPYQTVQRYYRPAPDLIAGFAIRTAVLS